MDLTSALRALRSLERRKASVDELQSAKILEDAILSKTKPSTEETTSVLHTQVNALKDLFQSEKWECIAAGFLSAQELLSFCSKEKISEETDELQQLVTSTVLSQLEHREPRVRSSAIGVLEELAKLDGDRTWSTFGKRLFDLVEQNFTLDEEERRNEYAELAARAITPVPSPATPPSSPRLDSLRKPIIAHETMGWKALETSMKSLHALLRGYGPAFVAEGHLHDLPLLDLVCDRAPGHENRYVREVGYFVCAALASVLAGSPDSALAQPEAVDRISLAIARGLCDNWSQVRYAASVASRCLCTGLSADQRDQHGPALVPRMCLNRYYLAEGVRLYSQRTWELVYGDQGPAAVARFAPEVVAFYCEQSAADNHGVREAACHSIAELASQVAPAAIAPHVPRLLAALVQCFRDESWPVRNAACVACAKFVKGFPEASRGSLEELFGLWFDHLSDNIWSVREDSAAALGVVMTVYPEAVDRVEAAIPDLLARVLQEEPAPPPTPELPSPDGDSVVSLREDLGVGVVAVSGSLRELRQAGDARHSNQTMFSCGSLAPKLRRGVGCMDHGFSRHRRHWEFTDGGVYLLRELARQAPPRAAPMMAALANAARHGGYPQEWLLQETIWKQLPAIAQAMGKREFKRSLEMFLGPMVNALRSNHQLAAHAAGYCVRSMREMLGQEVFKGRVLQEMDGERMWRTIENSPLAQ